METGSKTIGIFSYGWPEGFGKAPLRRRTPLALQRKAVWLKANPRDEDYMKTLFFSRWPHGSYVNADKDSHWDERVPLVDEIVLLYPDAIGLRFRSIEKRVFRLKKTWTSVRVLNGRRREFPLSNAALRQLHLRRFLERWMIGEIVATLLFVVATPLLFTVDWVRGRR